VDIVTSLATSDTSLTSRPLSWKYVPENTREIVNTGHGWRVDIDSEGSGNNIESEVHNYEMILHLGKSRDSSVGIALGYGLDDRGSGVRFPAGSGSFSLLHRVQYGSGAHPAAYPVGTRGSFPGGKVVGA
jgi:hypothetical protein